MSTCVAQLIFSNGCAEMQLAVGAVEHVEKAAARQLHRHLALDAVHRDVGDDHLPVRVEVVHLVREELEVPDDLAGLRPDREDRRGVEVVARPHGGIPRPGVAGAPVGEIELGIVGAGDPGRAAAAQVRVAGRPRVVPLLAGAGNRVGAPQELAGLGIAAVDEAAHAELGAGDAGDQHAVGDLRRAGHREAFLPLDDLLLPDLLAGLLVERDDVRVERAAEYLAVVDRRALVRDAAAHHARGGRIELDRRAPDLLAGGDVDRDRELGVGDEHDAVVDERLPLLAVVAGQRRAPDRHQALHVRLVDLLQRAVAVLVIAHPVGEHVVGVPAVVFQLLGRLRARRAGESARQQRGRKSAARSRKSHAAVSSRPSQSGGSAKVHTDPPSGTYASRARPEVP